MWSHWAQEQIFKWLEKGWAELCEDGTLAPMKKSPGEFIALANRAFGLREHPANFSDCRKITGMRKKSPER